MRILYVEDNEVNRALLERVVRARQCSIVFQAEGEGALTALAGDPAIDLVLLDIELADTCSGLEVIQRMRERGDRRPVVAITAYAMVGDRERILAAGCDRYLPKPVAISDLLELIDHYGQAPALQHTGEPARLAASPAADEATGDAPAAPPASDGSPDSAAPASAQVLVPADGPSHATAADGSPPATPTQERAT